MATKKKAAAESFIRVTQTHSAIRRQERQLLCLKALGLGRIGKTVRLLDTSSCRGLIRCVQHLVKIEVE
ncbi:MAG: 50S ribosomal protein L30 [Holosporales bacterium]|jgi:large subunit ribosomal protein L30|nr:50S ribosomal protein L30 [Holosporales bacterium]